MKTFLRLQLRILVVACALFATSVVFADNNTVLGGLQFQAKTKIEKTSGVWVDGQYVGFVKELKGSKKIMLLPGDHEIIVRQDGYQDFAQHVTLQPGETQIITVAMEKGLTGPMPHQTATVKINVKPERAAVFVDGLFVGHVGEFQGMGRGMLVAPGEHHIRIALPGYTSFETDINPLVGQKVEVKTELSKSSVPLPDPLLKGETTGQVTQEPPAPPPQ
jgi:hypothetical protein